MNTLKFLLAWSVLCSALHAANAPTPPVKPNILWIIMDDVGAELPCYGEKKIQTPNIDRLVCEGTRFDRAFLTASVCSPSRSAMITGMYQTTIGAHHHRSGRGSEKIHLPAGVEPVPALFQRAGYYTCNGDYPAKGKRLGKTDYNFEWDPKMYDGSDWAGRKPGQPFFAQIQLWGGKNRNDNGRWYRNVAPKALGTLTKPEEVTLPPYYPRDPVLLDDWAQYLDCIRLCDQQVTGEKWPAPAGTDIKDLTLRAQMSAVGVNLFIESAGKSDLIGCSDFSKHFDLRERKRIQQMDFAIRTDLKAGAGVLLTGASSCLSPGSGQADIRAITDEEGTPLLDEGRLWFTMTVRGRTLPHPLQGVFSLNPSVFDLRFEGIIVFDMDDGLLRNDLASHLFRDYKSGAWRGWTTGFSAFGGAGRAEEKAILAMSSVKDPRKGFSIMKAHPIGLAGAHEDPHGIYDKEAGKWRLLLCEHGKKYRAGMWESDHWDRGFTRLAGPVEMDSTGTMLQKFGNKRFALFGSADRKIYIRTYPNLEPAGELKVELPPWNDQNGTRIWPNVIPLPKGYPAPYIALMMDRVNFPGMPKPNWTYGALYLYHGYPTKP